MGVYVSMVPWQRSIGTTFSDREKQAPIFGQTLARAKKGDSEAIASLYRYFLPGVFGYIAARVPNRSIAEDLTSEVFLKMVEGIEKVRATEEASIAAWLIQIARVTVAGYYRQREKQPEVVSLIRMNGDDSTGINESTQPFASDPETDPVFRSEVREQWDVVVHAINSLTEEQRQVLVGRLILGYDIATVAQMIGKQANAVKALQFRALQSLNRFLAKKREPEMARPAQHQKVSRENIR